MITLDLLDSALHSVAIKNEAGDALAINASGEITISNTSFDISDGGNSITVDATALDIRALTSSDVVAVGDGANQLSIDASGFITSNINGTVTVDATDFDIRSLNAATDDDHVYITDSTGANALAVQSDGSLNVNSTRAGFGSWLVTQETVGTTESELVSTPLSNRIAVLIQNRSTNSDIYLKESTGVATSDLRIPKGASFAADLDENSNIFAIADSASSEVVVVEYAG